MLTSIKRIIRAGFVGFWRNGFVSLSAIFVMTITLTVVGGMMLTNVLLDESLVQIQDKVDINVYMVTTASEDRINDLQTEIRSLPDVADVTYTSRENALLEFTERHKNDELTMEALREIGENPLGASLSIRAKETTQYESIATFLKDRQARELPEEPLIYLVSYNERNKEAINKLSNIIDAAGKASSIMMVVLVLASVLIAFNTLRLAIYTSREEIGVMRLVGASNMYIRGPFVLQGIMYGIIAGILSLLILYPIALKLGPLTHAFFTLNIFEYFVQDFGRIFGTLLAFGIGLGAVSSTLAIARYLRV